MYPARLTAKYHEPGRNRPCVCGSGIKFKRCCGNSYSAEASKAFRAAFNRGDYEEALIQGRRFFTWYVLSHKAHTLLLLEANPDAGRDLLRVDIEALAELLENLHRCYFYLQRSAEFPKVLHHVRDLIDDPRWAEKVYFVDGLWHLVDRNDRAEAFKSISSIDIESCTDPDILTLYLDVCPTKISLSKSLNIIDRIISNTKRDSVRLQYRALKSVKYYLVCEKAEGDRIFKESINEYSAIPKEKQSIYGRVLLAHALETYGKAGGDKEVIENAKVVASDLIREAEEKGHSGDYIGNLWKLLGDCEEDLENHAAAIDAYTQSMRVKPSDLTKAFLARSICNDGKLEAARNHLADIDVASLDEPAKFDLAISWALLSASSLRMEDIEHAKERMRAIKADDPLFVQLRDRWLIDLLELKPTSDPGKIRRFIARLNSYITLNPNIFGIGINVNKIIDDIDSGTTRRQG